MTTAPCGYDDGRDALRRWDGAQGTEHAAAPEARLADADGNETEDLEAYEDHRVYIVVPTDDGWAIDDAYLN